MTEVNVASELDAFAKDFRLKLSDKARALITDYLVACTSKIMSILVVLTGHCSKKVIDTTDVRYLKLLSKLFLHVEPVEKAKKGHIGGAETTLPSDYFSGSLSSAYQPSAGAYHSMAPNDVFVRPPLPAGGDGSAFDNAFSKFSTYGQVGGRAMRELHPDAFSKILECRTIPTHPAIEDNAKDAIRFIIQCNLINLMTRMKTERRRSKEHGSSIRRGAPVTTTVIKSAIRKCAFVIPV